MITENGTVDSMHNSVLSNKVEGSTTIISLVPEGSRVNAPTVAEFDGVVHFMDTASESAKTIKLVAEDGKEKIYDVTLGEFSEILVKDRQQVRRFDYISRRRCLRTRFIYACRKRKRAADQSHDGKSDR